MYVDVKLSVLYGHGLDSEWLSQCNMVFVHNIDVGNVLLMWYLLHTILHFAKAFLSKRFEQSRPMMEK